MGVLSHIQLLRDSDWQVLASFNRATRICIARSMMSQDVCLFVYMSVCLSVTRRYCIETSKCRPMIKLFHHLVDLGPYHSSFFFAPNIMARVQRAFVQVRYEKSWFLSCVNYVSTCGALFRKWQKIWPYYDSLWNANANGTTVFPSEYGYPVWRVKTTCEMVKKFRREVFTLFVLTWTWQTDGQTDRHRMMA